MRAAAENEKMGLKIKMVGEDMFHWEITLFFNDKESLYYD